MAATVVCQEPVDGDGSLLASDYVATVDQMHKRGEGSRERAQKRSRQVSFGGTAGMCRRFDGRECFHLLFMEAALSYAGSGGCET